MLYVNEPLSLSPIAKANLLPYFHFQRDWAEDEKEKAYWQSVVQRVQKESSAGESPGSLKRASPSASSNRSPRRPGMRDG
jgi:hypothetical protein